MPSPRPEAAVCTGVEPVAILEWSGHEMPAPNEHAKHTAMIRFMMVSSPEPEAPLKVTAPLPEYASSSDP